MRSGLESGSQSWVNFESGSRVQPVFVCRAMAAIDSSTRRCAVVSFGLPAKDAVLFGVTRISRRSSSPCTNTAPRTQGCRCCAVVDSCVCVLFGYQKTELVVFCGPSSCVQSGRWAVGPLTCRSDPSSRRQVVWLYTRKDCDCLRVIELVEFYQQRKGLLVSLIRPVCRLCKRPFGNNVRPFATFSTCCVVRAVVLCRHPLLSSCRRCAVVLCVVVVPSCRRLAVVS